MTLKYDALIFDLDGTLWDATAATALAWTNGLRSLGYTKTITVQDVQSVTGLPFEECLLKLTASENIEDYQSLIQALDKEEVDCIHRLGGDLYPGVEQGMQKLSLKYRLYIVSNCQEWYLKYFLNTSSIAKFIQDWECIGRTKKPKHENISIIQNRNDIKNSIYIGDTNSDKAAANKAKTEFALIEHGFGNLSHTLQFKDFNSLVTYFL